MCITQISHIQEATQSDKVSANPDPIIRQALTSVDHAASSRLIGFLTGGLNLQSLHHTCPSLSLSTYHALYPKFVRVCQKHGFTPEHDCCTGTTIAKHLRYVYRLGRGDEFTPKEDVAEAAAPAMVPATPDVEGGGVAPLISTTPESVESRSNDGSSPDEDEEVARPAGGRRGAA